MKYPALFRHRLVNNLIVCFDSDCSGIVMSRGVGTAYPFGFYSSAWSSCLDNNMWELFDANKEVPLRDWLSKHGNKQKRSYIANNEYNFGCGDDLYFKVWDFTAENAGYRLCCEDFEITDVTKEQIINFAKAFGLELSDD